MMTKPWKEYRQEITRLYIQESRTLNDVREIMQRKHGFNASIRSYRQHFDQWGIGKYNCKRRPQRRNSAPGLHHLPSPPGTPMLPPMSTSGDDRSLLGFTGSGGSAYSDVLKLRVPDQRRGTSPSLSFVSTRSSSVSYSSTEPSAHRHHHLTRPPPPVVPSHGTSAVHRWAHGASHYGQGEGVSHGPPSSHSPVSVSQEQLSPPYVDQKVHIIDEMDWSAKPPPLYSFHSSNTPNYHEDHIIDAPTRGMRMHPPHSSSTYAEPKRPSIGGHGGHGSVHAYGRSA